MVIVTNLLQNSENVFHLTIHQNCVKLKMYVFSERERDVRYMPSSARLSSVMFVHPTLVIEIFCNVSIPCGTLAIHDLWIKIFTEIVPGVPLRRWGVIPKRGSQI